MLIKYKVIFILFTTWNSQNRLILGYGNKKRNSDKMIIKALFLPYAPCLTMSTSDPAEWGKKETAHFCHPRIHMDKDDTSLDSLASIKIPGSPSWRREQRKSHQLLNMS